MRGGAAPVLASAARPREHPGMTAATPVFAATRLGLRFTIVFACCLSGAVAVAQDRLGDVALPKVETWMAESRDAFSFRHAPQREEVAWFVASKRENRDENEPGRYLVAWSARGGGEVHAAELGDDLIDEERFVGPVWNHQADRFAVAITFRDGPATKTRVVVVDTGTAAATTWIEDVYPPGLSWAGDGRTLAVSDARYVHVLKGPRDEICRLEIPSEPGWGAAAAISPDGASVLAVSATGVYVLVRGEEPRRLGDACRDATIFTPPQWSPDGRRAVAVAGGAVTMIDVVEKKVTCVGEATLGGRAHAVAWVPGSPHVLAFVEQVRDGSIAELVRGAGHARQKYAVLPVVVAGDGEEVRPLRESATATRDPRFTRWFYRAQVSEALSRWSR